MLMCGGGCWLQRFLLGKRYLEQAGKVNALENTVKAMKEAIKTSAPTSACTVNYGDVYNIHSAEALSLPKQTNTDKSVQESITADEQQSQERK